MSKTPQVGDVVHVRGTVISVPPRVNTFVVTIAEQEGFANLEFGREAFVHIEPAPLKVGDRVYNIYEKTPIDIATIVAIDGEFAWLRYKLSNWVAEIRSLERAP